MKTFTGIILALITTTSIWAQAPEGFKYQAVARSSDGEALATQAVSLRISILQGSIDGASVYSETHSATTNAFGLFSLTIGNGTTGDSFNTIDWGTASYFVKIEMDANGGTSYVEFGTSQLLSVPYAMHAKTAENVSGKVTETDPVFGAHAASDITSTNITNWTSAYGWGDHALSGYLSSFTETDPIFEAHDASGITSGNITNWTTAYGWGDHSTVGYMTTMGDETDPVFGAHAASGISSGSITEWNTAFIWGDHAAAGYLTSMGDETDPVFGAHTASGITSGNITEWNESFGWGDHGSAGYLTGFTETDPVFSAWDKSTGISITEDQISDLDHFTTADETDPIFGIHAANGITSTNITNWTTAFGWNDHSIAGYLTSFTESDPIYTAWDKTTGITITESQITDLDHFTTADETDPVFSNLFSITSPTDNQLLKYNSGTSKWENWMSNFLTTEVDGDVTNEIQDLSLSSNTLSLTGDATSVDLLGYLDNTDNQNLSNVLTQGTDAGNNAMVNISQQGIGTASPNTSAALEINSTTQGFLPPRMTSAERDAISTPATGLMIYNTDENKWQGVNRTVWVNIDGSSCIIPDAPGAISGNTGVDDNATDEVYSIASVDGAYSYNWTVPVDATITAGQETTSITVTFGITNGNVSVRAENGCGNSTYTDLAVTVGIAIGNNHEGGIIFYLDGTGLHGLVAGIDHFGTGDGWGCYGTEISGADGTAVGTGAQNTIDIEAECTTAGTAADICANLSLNGYDDWFLPSQDELNLMHENLHLNGIGSFGSDDYWSSTEFDNDYAWIQSFSGGNQTIYVKYYGAKVRAVRAF